MKSHLIYGLIFLLLSCNKDESSENNTVPGTVSINGKAQKGPYKNGSPLVIFELNNSLGQTGKSFSSIINDDVGNFALNNIGLSSGYALTTANGYYYMEHFNAVSSNQLYLEAISEVSNNTTINVNLLTHIIKPRIEFLVSGGSSFAAARTQAQNEFKSFMGISSGINSNFDQLEITSDAFLFAVSLIFQRRTPGYVLNYNYTSELSSLLNNFRNDFKDNGQINSASILDTLVYNANRIQLIDVKENLQNYMASLGVTIVPPGFEQYVFTFQKLYSSYVFTNIIFPDTAWYEAGLSAPTKVQNILYQPVINFQGGGHPYLFAAEVPCDSSLIIKFTLLNASGPNPYSLGQPRYGWKLTNTSGEFTVEAQQRNFQNALMVYLWGSQNSARIEYFQNNDPSPYFSKTIYW